MQDKLQDFECRRQQSRAETRSDIVEAQYSCITEDEFLPLIESISKRYEEVVRVEGGSNFIIRKNMQISKYSK